MTLDEVLGIGVTVELGTHRFAADAIKTFARRYDPQPFHLDEEIAKNSVFGALCASGWHTASVWMRLNIASLSTADGHVGTVEWGPSPGIQNLRWLKPVFAGETVSFTRRALSHRRLASRPGWRVLTLLAGAADGQGEAVLSFEGAVLVKAA